MYLTEDYALDLLKHITVAEREEDPNETLKQEKDWERDQQDKIKEEQESNRQAFKGVKKTVNQKMKYWNKDSLQCNQISVSLP